MSTKTQRRVSFLTQGQAAMDGAGVRLTRIIGNQQLKMLDPFLLLAANPLNETVVRSGPFVMNTREQLMQAYDDFQNNQFLN